MSARIVRVLDAIAASNPIGWQGSCLFLTASTVYGAAYLVGWL